MVYVGEDRVAAGSQVTPSQKRMVRKFRDGSSDMDAPSHSNNDANSLKGARSVGRPTKQRSTSLARDPSGLITVQPTVTNRVELIELTKSIQEHYGTITGLWDKFKVP